MRAAPDEFLVVEELGFVASGDGEHDFLTVEKTATNTDWLARKLAQHAGIKSLDVGYAGLKDRHAVTTQTFTVRRPNRDGTDWAAFSVEGARILDVQRHNRKLKRGAHVANHFRIGLRADLASAERTSLQTRWQQIVAGGVPNYFGPQRFGRSGNNLALARDVLSGKRVRREQRSIAISAARSFLFNEILAARVSAGTWDCLIDGDLANLDGSGSVFSVEAVDETLIARCAAFDIHPTATLWGDGAPLTSAAAAGIETDAVAGHTELTEGLVNARIDAGSRPLRLRLADTSIEFGDGIFWLSFRLPKGAFATSVIRELVTDLP